MLRKTISDILPKSFKLIEADWKKTWEEVPHIFLTCIDDQVFTQDVKESTRSVLSARMKTPKRQVSLVIDAVLNCSAVHWRDGGL